MIRMVLVKIHEVDEMSGQDNHPPTGDSAVDLAKECVLGSRCEDLNSLLDGKAEELLSRLEERISSSAVASDGQIHDGDLLRKCRESARDMAGIVSMISFYGDEAQLRESFEPLFAKLVEKASPDEMPETKARVYWYAICFVYWLACISAIANGNYGMLAALFNTQVPHPEPDVPRHRLLESVAEGLKLLQGTGALRGGSTSDSIDRSNHFAIEFKPFFEGLEPWFVGSGTFTSGNFGNLFNRLEMLQAVEHRCPPSSNDNLLGQHVFGGRFLETKDAGIIKALEKLWEEVVAKRGNWPPYAAGVFRCGVDEIIEILGDMMRMGGVREG